MSNPRQRVIGYGRVSTEEQESNYSLDAQRSRFESLVKQNKWQSLGFFQETGSGTSILNRPGLCKILQRIQDGGVDALWVKETDRLSRPENLGDLSMISQALESSNTLLIVDTRSMDLREDNSVLMLDFEGVLAKHFRRQLLRNMNRGKTRKAEMGRKASGIDIFGYKANEDGKYFPHPDEAKIVKLIFELTAKDYTMRQVRAELKRRGIKTRWGRDEWSVAVLSALLRNDVYIGIYRFKKTTPRRKDVDGVRYKITGESPDQIIVGTREKPNHTPLIDPALFDLVQRKIQVNRHKNSTRLYMATGLLRCSVCSAPLHAKYSTTTGRRLRVVKYTCPKKPNCTSKRILVSETNDILWRALVELFMDPERIHTLLTHHPEDHRDSLNRELAAIEKDHKTVKEKLERLLNLYLEGNLPQTSYVLKSSELESEADRLSQKKSDLNRRIQTHGQSAVSANLIQTIRLLSRSHRRFTEEQKTKVFRSLIKETRITEAGVEFEMYGEPTQNVWKYRQKATPKRSHVDRSRTLRVSVPQIRQTVEVFSTPQVAQMLGVSADHLRYLINTGKYPDAPRDGRGRLFTQEHIQKLRKLA